MINGAWLSMILHCIATVGSLAARDIRQYVEHAFCPKAPKVAHVLQAYQLACYANGLHKLISDLLIAHAGQGGRLI